MSGTGDEPNAYELLGLEGEASEAQVKTAYRQRSLKVHPDRHPNNPEAGVYSDAFFDWPLTTQVLFCSREIPRTKPSL